MSPVAQFVRQFGPLPVWLMYLAVFAVGLAAGVQLTSWVAQAEIAALRQQQAERTATAERQARERLQDAQDRGDRLTAQLTTANTTAAALQKDLADALTHVTTGRRCLDGAALRLLDSAPGIAAPRLPTAPRVAAAADAAHAAADTAQRAAGDEAATDTDVSLWASGAAGKYGECVRRLDALIDFETYPTTAGDLQ